MKIFNQWYEQDAWPAVKELPEVAVRAIFEAGQDNPDVDRVGKVAYMCELSKSIISDKVIDNFWEQIK